MMDKHRLTTNDSKKTSVGEETAGSVNRENSLRISVNGEHSSPSSANRIQDFSRSSRVSFTSSDSLDFEDKDFDFAVSPATAALQQSYLVHLRHTFTTNEALTPSFSVPEATSHRTLLPSTFLEEEKTTSSDIGMSSTPTTHNARTPTTLVARTPTTQYASPLTDQSPCPSASLKKGSTLYLCLAGLGKQVPQPSSSTTRKLRISDVEGQEVHHTIKEQRIRQWLASS